MRLELLTPAGDLLLSDTYNKLFSMHGTIMVWFFLVPAIPTTLGNFSVPVIIGAKDLASPRLNLLSWYLFVVAGSIELYAILTGGFDTGWMFYTLAVGYLLPFTCLLSAAIRHPPEITLGRRAWCGRRSRLHRRTISIRHRWLRQRLTIMPISRNCR